MRHYGYMEQIQHPEQELFSFLGGDDITVIMVIAENHLNGYVYRYGNYGDFWVQIGSVRGYE
ncbi:hypothetical protein [[Clostridium] scindens]|uniref:hypothetical protein n=1 Tax=Clostridium scindens (strain JCM 10418 / VPI 12708) TaxID=29347 RepID=UPI0039F58AB8